jgi:hypothetical protein
VAAAVDEVASADCRRAQSRFEEQSAGLLVAVVADALGLVLLLREAMVKIWKPW